MCILREFFYFLVWWLNYNKLFKIISFSHIYVVLVFTTVLFSCFLLDSFILKYTDVPLTLHFCFFLYSAFSSSFFSSLNLPVSGNEFSQCSVTPALLFSLYTQAIGNIIHCHFSELGCCGSWSEHLAWILPASKCLISNGYRYFPWCLSNCRFYSALPCFLI